MHDKRNRVWAAYCREMAQASYALADRCSDPELLQAYVRAGAKWVNLGIDAQRDPVDLHRLTPANLLPA